jgi:Family of unknown function (DUF6186)
MAVAGLATLVVVIGWQGPVRTRTGRVGVLVAWAWLGLHFFSQ